MEDGTLAVIFWLWALASSKFDITKEAETPGLTFAYGETFVDREKNGSELRFIWHRDHRFGPLQPTIDVSFTHRGGAYIGAGFRQEAHLGGPFYLSGQAVTGLWLDDLLGNDEDLGGLIEFRTGFALEADLGDGRVAVGWDHRSNADLGRINPGLEVLSVRYTMRY